METYVEGGFHVLFTEVTGTGKTVSISNMLLNGFNKERFAFMSFAFSAQNTANQMQDIFLEEDEHSCTILYFPKVKKTSSS